MAHEIITAETSDRLEQQALHMRVTTEINKFVDFTFLSNASQWLVVYLEVTVVSRCQGESKWKMTWQQIKTKA